MTKPAVLIVGAGATGLPVGYHLSLGDADVTFLVRPGRKAAFEAPQRLYCYDDASLKTFDGYDIVEDVSELAGRRFEFVLVTLDGHASLSEAGTDMLRALGDATRPSDATVIMCAFGMGVREHYLETMGIPESRLLHGFLGMLSHQAGAGLPVHPPTDPAKVAQAAICYRHPKSRKGFRVETGNPAAAKRFAALYERSGVSKCARFSKDMSSIFSTIAFPVYVAFELEGWADIATVTRNRHLWRLACRAQKEILTLPQHGWRGKAMSLVIGPRVNKMVHVKSERDMLPMDSPAFERFHHGGKVRAQGVESMYRSLDEGRRQGRPMNALRALLELLEAHEQAARTVVG
jgi:hypothetical protein